MPATLPIYQVDAFTDRLFAGNPAAVVPLGEPLPAAVMQAIALENNLSETAFLLGGGGAWDIRWFTPALEVDLCGHATIAAAFVVMHRLEPGLGRVVFRSRRHGDLPVEREGSLYHLEFPSLPPDPLDPPAGLAAALAGAEPLEVHAAGPLVVLLRDEEAVRAAAPDLAAVASLPFHGLVLTAPGRACDFVSRYFVPQAGIPEDPATGSSHCVLAPFWAARLGKPLLRARQVSRRGGEILCEVRGDRVRLGGGAVLYLEGRIDAGG